MPNYPLIGHFLAKYVIYSKTFTKIAVTYLNCIALLMGSPGINDYHSLISAEWLHDGKLCNPRDNYYVCDIFTAQ